MNYKIGKIKSGDRVRVFESGGGESDGVVVSVGEINNNHMPIIKVKPDKNLNAILYCHPRQLCRLKPKQKPVAREIFINEYNGRLNDVWHDDVKRADALGCGRDRRVTFREVLQNPTSNEVGG